MSETQFPKRSPDLADPYQPRFEIHRYGQPVEISTKIPTGSDGKPLEISTDQLSFYESPPESREEAIKRARQILVEAKNNRFLKDRLELLQHLHFLKLPANALTAKIHEKLPELLFNQLDGLLHPEGYSINEKYFVQSVNQLFAMVYGKLPQGKDYFSAQEIKEIFKSRSTHGLVERATLFQELDLRAREKQSLTPQTFPTAEQIQAWLSKTEIEGFRGSMDQETEILSEMQKTLHKEGKATKDAQYLLGVSAQIRELLKQEKFEAARNIYLQKYAPSRLFFIDRYARYENGKKLKTIALHLAIMVASAAVGGVVGAGVGAAFNTTHTAVQAGNTLVNAAKVMTKTEVIAGAFLGFGPGFVITQKTFNHLLLDQRFFDPKKSGFQNGLELAVESILMGGLHLYLGAFLIASRMRSLLPTMAQRGLTNELVHGGALKPLSVEFSQILNREFIKEIAAMPTLHRYLFKGSEFFQEVGAFVPYQIVESQIRLLSQGNLPSAKNFEVIDQLLKPETQIEQALFLLAFKAGNRAVESHLETARVWARGKVKEWKEKGFFATPPSPEATALTMGLLSLIFPESIPIESLPAAGMIMGSLKIKKHSHLPAEFKSELKYRIKRNSDWQVVSDGIDKISQLIESLKSNPTELKKIKKGGNYLTAAKKNLVVLVESLLDPQRFFTQSDRIDLLERYFHTIKSGDNLKIDFEINNAELRSWIYGVKRLLSLHKNHPEKKLLKNLLEDFQSILESTSNDRYRRSQINALKGHSVLEKIYDCVDIFIDAPIEEIYAAAKKGEEGALEALLKQDRSNSRVIDAVIDLAVKDNNLKAQAALKKWNLPAQPVVSTVIKSEPVRPSTPPAPNNVPITTSTPVAKSLVTASTAKPSTVTPTPALAPKPAPSSNGRKFESQRFYTELQRDMAQIRRNQPSKYKQGEEILALLLEKVYEMRDTINSTNADLCRDKVIILMEIARADWLLTKKVKVEPGKSSGITFQALMNEMLRQIDNLIAQNE